jgi:hypothetical protein
VRRGRRGGMTTDSKDIVHRLTVLAAPIAAVDVKGDIFMAVTDARREIMRLRKQREALAAFVTDQLAIFNDGALLIHGPKQRAAEAAGLIERNDRGDWRLSVLGRAALAVAHEKQDRLVTVKPVASPPPRPAR